MFEDKGVGIPDAAMPYLFDRFYRVDKARKQEGTGLGLSIVQQIVQLLNGKISVTSELGEGSSFEIIFEI
ncbi:Signal transduction histidine-protein kinase ArlS [compost metagenome]